MKNNEYICGVGGWLTLLIIIFMVLSPLLGFGSLYGMIKDVESLYSGQLLDSKWASFKQETWIIYAISASVSFAAGYRLLKIHKSESVRFAIIANWLVGPIANVAYVISGALLLNLRVTDQIHASIGSIAGSCIVASLWTAYLLRSKRVKNTYHQH
ncbi:DUF2569 family protein [Herminiimonas contaminans]|uniref:DUF2569 family protein n=1 Tax=Herminiimonas contaminans TaxID=1111140 RepID=A0ABS0ESK6_9BURK|nr:DUF2569 family protein [Herminiimonas contaminans]MBF8177835.1 DUF2569 family protein [Herminiimonas contaminans]